MLNWLVSDWEKIYGKKDEETTVAARLQGVVQRAYEKTGKQVVILVDEYDKPMLQTFDNEILQEKFYNILKAFYSVLKTTKNTSNLLFYRCYQIQPIERFQRFEQLARYFIECQLRHNLRDYGK